MMAGTVGDLVAVPRVRTVVQLADRRDPALRDEILESFVLTGEVMFNLMAIVSSAGTGKGRGFFLQGSFGSGKSHFLAVLGFLLENPEAWRHLKVEGTPMAAVSMSVAGRRFLPVAVSLVEHGARERLEEIVLDSLGAELATRGLEPLTRPRFPQEYVAVLQEKHGEALARFAAAEGLAAGEALFASGGEEALERFLAAVDFPFRTRYDRRETFESLPGRLAAAGFAGAVVLIDELSEFLRSKTDARGFNEEIRFLQFLGEFGEKNPLWVVATLQERIEDTGEITQSAFNKIKDRYPGRLALTGKHLEDLIARRLLPKRQGAGGRISEIYKSHARSFSGFDPGQARFESLYPVHPATLFVLEELKSLFSQHRGVVDFITARVGGDPRRSIAGILAEPDTALLTADAVFDHFQPRIKEMVETNPFLEVVYRYFELEAPRLFPELAEQALALRLVKLIILGAISPIRRDFSASELADMLLYSLTSLTSEPNYQYVHDLLEKLRTSGAYLVVEKREGGFKDVYRLDLEADVNLVIRRRIAYIRSTLFPDDHRLFSRLLAFVDPPHLPLGSLAAATRRRVQCMWQYTRREGFLLFVPTDELTPEKLAAIDAELSSGDADFVFVVSPPGVPCRPPASGNIALWEPAPVGHADREDLAMILSKLLLADEQQEQTGTLAERVAKQLEMELENDRRRVREIFERIYFTGRIHLPGGKTAEPARWGYIPLEQITERAAAAVLEHRFPGHLAIAPHTSAYLRDRETDLIEGFFKPGEIDLSQPGARTLQVYLEGYLKPLGVLKKAAGSKLLLSVDARRSEPVRALLDVVPEGTRTELAGALRAVRKGPLGVGREQARMLLWSVVFSGQVSLYAEGKRLTPEKLNGFAIERATELARGDLVPQAARTVLAEVPFLSVTRKAGEQFNVGVQQAAWDELVAAKRAASERLANLAAALAKALTLPSLAELGLGKARHDLDVWQAMEDEVAVSYSAREGLERFAAHWAGTPGLREALERVERLEAFLAGGPERFVAAAAYVRHPGLALSPADEHAAAASALQEVRALLSDAALPFRAGALDELIGAFEQFLAAYGPLYAAHHERQHGASRFEPFRRLKSGREYALLSRLSTGLGEGVCDEFPRLQRTLGQVLGRMCTAFDPVALKMAPICRCGLTLAEQLELPEPSALLAALEAGVADSLRTLLTGRMREAITAAAVGLREARRSEQAAELERFLALEPVASDVAGRLEEMLDSGTGRLLREALAGRLVVVERDLDELVEALVDRSFEPADLMIVIGRWLGEVPAGGLVRVQSGRAGKGEGLVSVVEGAFPDLLPLLRELGEERFVEAVFTARWLEQVGLADAVLEESLEHPGLAAHLPAARELVGYLLERHSEMAASSLEALEVRLEADGTAERLAALALSGRDRQGLIELIASDDVFEFARRRAVEVWSRHLKDESREALGRLVAEPLPGAFGQALAAAAALELAVRDCERALKKPLDAGGWELLHREALAGSPLALLEARAALAAVGAEAQLPEERWRAAARKLESDFREHYAAGYAKLVDPAGGHPVTLADLAGELVPRFAKRLAAAGVACVVVDAMRQDFFDYLRREVLPLAQGTFRLVESLTAWAFAPTLTAPNLDALLTGRRPGGAGSPPEADAERPRLGRAALEEFSERTGMAVVKYNALDDRVHTTREDLRTLYRETAMALAPAMLPFLDRLPARTLIVFTADHGFRERPDYQARHDAPRYAHGGISPFEVLVPVGIYLKV